MEVDLIILPKESNPAISGLEIKHQIEGVFEQLYSNIHDDCFTLEMNNEAVLITYQLSAKTANMLFVKFTCDYTPAKAARVMDIAVNLLVQGEHRKSWNIVISYDEVSELYCFKLMPLFGRFERRTRELVYLTIIKIFGVEWYEKSFSQNLQSILLGKGKGNKTKLVEGALNELTYEQLKEYLFVPFSNQLMSDALNVELSKEKIEAFSKDELISIIDKCRSVSLWERFFSEYKQFKDFHERIEKLQPYRNSVMHHKRITQVEFERVRKELTSVNKRLEEAILLLEDEMYTETKLVEVVSALGNMLSNVLGTSISNWVDKMKPALASFGKLAIEAAMPQINISQIIPTLNLGTEIAQHFHEVYQVPKGMLQAVTQMAEVQSMIRSSIPERSYLNSMNSIIKSPGMQAVAEIAEQTKTIKAMLDIPKLAATSPLMSALNSPSMIAAKEIAEQHSRFSQQILHSQVANMVLLKDVKFEQDDELPSNESTDKNGEDNQETDSSSNE